MLHAKSFRKKIKLKIVEAAQFAIMKRHKLYQSPVKNTIFFACRQYYFLYVLDCTELTAKNRKDSITSHLYRLIFSHLKFIIVTKIIKFA